MISTLLNTYYGQVILSILLGLGLALLFKRACKDNCFIIRGPNNKEINQFYYKIDDDCYKYKPYVTKCTDDKVGAEDTSK